MHIEMTTGRRIVPASRGDEFAAAQKALGRKWAQCCWLSPELVAQIELGEQKAITGEHPSFGFMGGNFDFLSCAHYWRLRRAGKAPNGQEK
jgi:hypothetical protein